MRTIFDRDINKKKERRKKKIRKQIYTWIF